MSASRTFRTRSTCRQTARGFTLVELLVVVGIVGLLVSVLLPALAGARRSGQGVACQSNLRQLGLALETYVGENRGFYAPAAPGIATTNRVRWFGSRAGGGAFAGTGGPLSDHLGGVDGVRRCASLVTSAGGFERAAGGYGYNAAFVGTLRARTSHGAWMSVTDASGSPQARFMSPGETIGFADCALATSSAAPTVIEYSFAEPDQWPDAPGASPDPSVHFRHGGVSAGAIASGSSVTQSVFLDGHVTQLRRGRTSGTSIYASDPAAAGLGWPETHGINALFDYE